MSCMVEVKDIEKSFKLYQEKRNSLKERILFAGSRYEKCQVLRGVSFQAEQGQAIGLIGKNGCGKSTLLKLLSKIYEPDAGSITICGRVSSLIELGAGFHPDMSGRENIYTNASIFGLRKKEIDDRLQDIIDFSELEEFIDSPVRTYSSGMYMRLAFSVAIHVDADVLLIDEILAVGDVSFQKKCFEKIKEIKKSGTTIILVSHSMNQIEEICDETIWLESGRIREKGIPKDVHAHYSREMEKSRLQKIREKNQAQTEKLAFGNALTIRNHPDMEHGFTDIYLLNDEGERADVFRTGDDIRIVLEHSHGCKRAYYNISFAVTRMDGTLAYSTNRLNETGTYLEAAEESVTKIDLQECCLIPADYMINAALFDEEGRVLDEVQRAVLFRMVSQKPELGICRLKHQWIDKEL